MGASTKLEMLESPEPKGLVPFTKESLELMKQRIAKKHNEEHEDDLEPNIDLEVGRVLSSAYGNLSPELVSAPLEDVDPYYNKNTFMVLNKNRTIFRFNATSTCCTLSPFDSVRRTLIKVLVHPFFRLFILISVLTDCIFMTKNNFVDWITILENTLLGIYTLEILVKLIARGIWAGPFSFFGDPWNWLDFSVTLFEFIMRSLPGSSSILVTARTLRILKIIPLCQGVKSLVGKLNDDCWKKLGGVVALTMLSLSVFSLIGMGLFMGNLKHKCLRWPQESDNGTLYNRTANPYYSREMENYYYLEGERDALLCGKRTDASQCPEGYICVKDGRNPDYGYTNFDNFGWAFLALFRLMTQDYPEALYHQILYASGKIYMVFFVVVSFWFAFYMASLFLGILAVAHEEEKQERAERAKKMEPGYQQNLKQLQEGKADAQNKTTQIEMKKRPSPSVSTTVDMLDDATLRQKEDVKGTGKACPLCWYKFAKTFFIWNCSPCWLKLKEFVHKIIMDPFTDFALLICIILNILFLALEHHPMNEETNNLLGIGNLVFIGIFTAEMILKIIAMHPYGYFHAGWNIFDSIVVFLGLTEIFLMATEGLSIVRLFRMLRIFKLGKYWPTFTKLMWTLGQSLVALKNVIVLLVMFIFFSAVLGLKVFRGSYEHCVCKVDEDCQLPRWHMHDFFHSFLTVFRILCGEWIETLWECFEVASQITCIPFYIMIILIGNLVILYLFVALVSSFSAYQSAAIEESNEAKNVQLAMARIKEGINNVLLRSSCKKAKVLKERVDNVHDVYVQETTSDNTLSALSNTQEFPRDKEKSSGSELNTLTEKESQSLIPSPTLSETVPIASGESDLENPDNKDLRSKSGDRSSKEKIKPSSSSECSTVDIAISEEEEMIYEREKPKHPQNVGNGRRSSPGQIGRENKKRKIWQNIRKTCCKIVENSWFKCFIGLVTLLSTGALAFEDIYINQRKTIKILLEYADMIFTYIFILEMLLKWMAYGFKAYFSNAWYRLDFLVVIVFCLNLIGKSREDLRPLTSTKFLRALRVLSQFERMKVVVRALIKTTLPTVSVFLVCLVIWLAFSIMGVQLFAGKFYECIDPTSGERFPVSEVQNKSQCESLLFNDSMPWENAEMNFDNVGNGFLSLLQVATFNGWIDIMNSAVDSIDINLQPNFEDNIYMYCYFISFIICGLFLPLSMLIGAIVANFNKLKIKGGSNIFITVKQKRQCRGLKRLMSEDSQRPIPRPRNKFQGFIFGMVTSQIFNVIILVLIFAYALTLVIESDNESQQMKIASFWITTIFALLYTGEFLLKVIAFRCYYFTIGWNIFDFMVVVFSITGIALHVMTDYLISPTLTQLILLSRIIHVLRLGKGPKVFHNLLLPLMFSLPALLNLSLLIFLVMFAYAILGMYNFAYLKKELGINDVSNFETFGSSMLCIFQVTIFAGWDGMLNTIFHSKWSDCDPDKINPGTQIRGDCGNPYVGIAYFVSYIFIAWLIIVNMYIVVIMEFFNIVSKKKAKTLSEDDFRRFFQVWERFDPEKTQYIDSSKLSDLAAALPPPLLMAKPNKGQLVAMDLPMAVGDRIHCLDILLALTRRVLGKDERMEKVLSEIETGFMLANPFKITYEPITTTLKRKQETVSATIIQRAYKSYRLRQNVKNTSDIHMIDDDEDVKATKEEKHLGKAEGRSTI